MCASIQGPAAASAASSLGAQAFAVGPHIAFNTGPDQLGTGAGRRLLAHELAHVLPRHFALRRPPLSAAPHSASRIRGRPATCDGGH